MTTNMNEAGKATGMTRPREDDSGTSADSSPFKKQKVAEGVMTRVGGEELALRLMFPKARIYVQSNEGGESNDDMIRGAISKGLKFPRDLELEIMQLDDDDKKNGEDFKVVILGNESDHWKVQISFLKDWVFTLTIKKDMKKEVTLQFAEPCYYKGHPLKVEKGCASFQTFHRADVTWSTAEFPESSGFPYLSIYLDDPDDCIGMMHVEFDEVLMALASSHIQVGIRFQPNVGDLADLFNYFKTAHCRLPFGLIDEIKGFSPNYLGPQKVWIDCNKVQLSFSHWVFTFAISKDRNCLRFTYPCLYKNHNLVEKGKVVNSFEFPTYAPIFRGVSWDSVKLQNKGIYISLIHWGADADGRPIRHEHGGIFVYMEDFYSLLVNVIDM